METKNKHEIWELRQMQALPLESKITMNKTQDSNVGKMNLGLMEFMFRSAAVRIALFY